MVILYPPGCTDFSNNGLGLLEPFECTVEEHANGMYELVMELPITDTSRFSLVACGCIVKVDAPVRDAPISAESSGSGGQEIWKIGEPQWWLDLRKGPGKGYTYLETLGHSAEMIMLEYDSGWSYVKVVKGGQVGYVQTKFLAYVRTTAQQDDDATEVTVSRAQLFRLYSVETDTNEGVMTARAMHIFYDQRGDIIEGELKPEKQDVQSVLSSAYGQLSYKPAIDGHWGGLEGDITGEYSWRSMVEAVLSPDDGILKQVHGTLFRDNFDYYLLPDEEIDRGVTIRRGKNLIGVRVTTDDSTAVTRIIPVGKDGNGEDLFIDEGHVDSAHINEYPFIRVARRDYDVKVDSEGEYKTEAQAKAALKSLAEAEFEDDEVDLPDYGMEVDFVAMQDVAGSEDYANLQSIHMFDMVTVIDEVIGLNKTLRVTAYVWDVNRQRYQSVTLGSLKDLDQSYGFNVG